MGLEWQWANNALRVKIKNTVFGVNCFFKFLVCAENTELCELVELYMEKSQSGNVNMALVRSVL